MPQEKFSYIDFPIAFTKSWIAYLQDCQDVDDNQAKYLTNFIYTRIGSSNTRLKVLTNNPDGGGAMVWLAIGK